MIDSAPEFLQLGVFHATGDLRTRLHRNFDRLEEEKYQPENVFQREKEAGNWPGDTEGRTLLALVLLAQAAGGRQPKYLDAILERWPRELNVEGYFGVIQPDGLISEQQLSGHGWVLRALSELQRWRPGGGARALAQPVIERLILPTRGQHRSYPLEPAARRAEGSFSGTHLGRVGNWLLSTDVGCDFICLDGVVDACEAFGDERLRPLVEEMVERFLELDLLAVKAQTHATLTACRALLRWSDLSGDRSLVVEVEKRFELYTRCAWTDHHANFNWFGRPEWTEPCAIVDSLMVAMELWRRTRHPHYLEQAHLIYFNALGHAQRSNGGFGCDNCPGADGEADLFFKVYEAHWCCTMRGGEGLSRLTQYAIARTRDTLLVLIPLSGVAQGAGWRVTITAGYPEEPRLQLEAQLDATSSFRRVEVLIPSWWRDVRAIGPQNVTVVASGSWLHLPLSFGETRWSIEGSFTEGLRPCLGTTAPSRRAVRVRGPLVLAEPVQSGKLQPIFSAYHDAVTDPAASRRRLIVEQE